MTSRISMVNNTTTDYNNNNDNADDNDDENSVQSGSFIVIAAFYLEEFQSSGSLACAQSLDGCSTGLLPQG